MRRLKTLVGAGSFAAAANDPNPQTGPQRAVALARKAEAAGITGLFTADLLQVDPEGLGGTTGSQEPIVTLAALSQVTSRIGLVATVSTSFQDPYNLARLLGTLDHVSGGRAAWNAVTSSVGEENFGGGDLPDPAARYDRAAEFIAVVNALFDGGDPDAVQRGPGGAVRIDAGKLHRIDHRGGHFAVQGPLNVPPSPQRRPVQFQAGQSDQGVTLGARYAEVVYTSQPTLEGAIAFVGELHRRARGFGRAERLPRIMNSLHGVMGESAADVARRLREKHERIDNRRGRLKLADMLGGGIDLSDLPLDRPLPEHILPKVQDIRRRRGRAEIFRAYALQGLSLRELIIRAEETGHWFVAGTPEDLADAVEERFRAGVLDVVSLHGLGQPEQEDLLLNGLLPVLRQRGLIDDGYVGDDFRSNLELPALGPPRSRAGDLDQAPSGPHPSQETSAMPDTIIHVPLLGPQAQAVLDGLLAESVHRYGADRPGGARAEIDRYPAPAFMPPLGDFLVLLRHGQPIAGGAFMSHDDETAEIKRVWTHPDLRRQGLARRIMQALEDRAGALGYTRAYLTTGFRQPEAVALYRSIGYRPLFDPAADPALYRSLPFEKHIGARSGQAGQAPLRRPARSAEEAAAEVAAIKAAQEARILARLADRMAAD